MPLIDRRPACLRDCQLPPLKRMAYTAMQIIRLLPPHVLQGEPELNKTSLAIDARILPSPIRLGQMWCSVSSCHLPLLAL